MKRSNQLIYNTPPYIEISKIWSIFIGSTILSVQRRFILIHNIKLRCRPQRYFLMHAEVLLAKPVSTFFLHERSHSLLNSCSWYFVFLVLSTRFRTNRKRSVCMTFVDNSAAFYIIFLEKLVLHYWSSFIFFWFFLDRENKFLQISLRNRSWWVMVKLSTPIINLFQWRFF